jgi:hypothetical protein
VWLGCNFGGGKKVEWEFTPMLGGVFGETTGIAPGYKGSVRCWKLEFYSEGQYVIDAGDSSGSYLYNWSELTVAPVEWLPIGLVTQRTRAYEAERDIQRGFLVSFAWKNTTFTTYVLNSAEARPTLILAGSVTF